MEERTKRAKSLRNKLNYGARERPGESWYEIMYGKFENTDNGYYYVVKLADNGIDLYEATVHVTDWAIEHGRYIAFKVGAPGALDKKMDWKTAMEKLDWIILPNSWKKTLDEMTHDYAVVRVAETILEHDDLYGLVMNCVPAYEKLLFDEIDAAQFQEAISGVVIKLISLGLHGRMQIVSDAVGYVCKIDYKKSRYVELMDEEVE